MNYLSVCSGIEAAATAWHSLGWKPVGFGEIEPFPSAVLAHHWPHVRNYGDMTRFAEWDCLADADILVGGTPCQAFSVAGLRNSLDDARGNLTLTYVRMLDEIDRQRNLLGRPAAVCVWENVPGVLSTKDNAFGCFLGGLAGSGGELQPPDGSWKWSNAGYVRGPVRSVAWRVLDAQYFGVAQRRRRVFVVASADAGFRPEQVLFECEGVRRDSPPRREAGEGNTGDVAPSLRAQGQSSHRLDSYAFAVSPSVTSKWAKGCGRPAGDECQNLVATAFDMSHAEDPVRLTGDAVNTLQARMGTGGNQVPCVAASEEVEMESCEDCPFYDAMNGDCTALESEGYECPIISGKKALPAQQTAVRRLTPEECETLQGFPQLHTRIPWRNKPAADCPDGNRYKAIGNSMAVPVMAWIGKKINERKTQ